MLGDPVDVRRAPRVSGVLPGWYAGTIPAIPMAAMTRQERPIGGWIPASWMSASASRTGHVTPRSRLTVVKVVHTIAWAFFAGCIVLIPIATAAHLLDTAAILIGVVFVEVLILLAFGWNCPLTLLAGRYTADRHDNFDIYLPNWLARYNKRIFGTLYVTGIVVTAWAWLAETR
jgi:hypothetical protein